MRILVIGATGTIGRAVVHALQPRHEIVSASHRTSKLTVDIAQPDSIGALLNSVGTVDAIVSVAGKARMAPLAKLSDEDFQFCLDNKLMGQVNVVRLGLPHVRDGGSITLTSGVLSHTPMIGSAAISLVNAGLEGFIRAAALEAPRGIRVNVVSPPWVTETLQAYKMEVPGGGRPAAEVALVYARAVEGSDTGQTLALPAR
ncbi:MAG: short chain dehydrogenase [Opitutaceae bacterium]|nr:short chain dehydrogenase [Opitutaceae bacterium]